MSPGKFFRYAAFPRARPWLAAVSSGILLFLAAPGPFSLPWLAWLALVPLLLGLAGRSPRQAALLGLVCGLAYYLPLLHWIVIVLATYGQVPFPIALLALFLLALYMSFYLAAFAFFCARTSGHIPVLFFAPACWTALEFVRGFLFSGFPWLDLACTQFMQPVLIQISDLAGHHGLSFVIVLSNVLLASLALSRTSRGHLPGPIELAASLALLLSLGAYGLLSLHTLPDRLAKAEKLQVAVVQGNIPQDQKWQPAFQKATIDSYLALSGQTFAATRPDLVVWPETALPFYPYENPLFLRLHGELTRPFRTFLLTGVPHREPEGFAENKLSYSNSAFIISPDGLVTGRYDKEHLVPFGEYIPFRRLLGFASPLVETLGEFSPGRKNTPVPCLNSKIGVLICFESIFPEIARKQVTNGANLLITLTNDAWFGRSGAPYQHLAMAVFRAVETRRSLVRAANTGISAFIDPLGRIEGASPLFEEYAATRTISLLDDQTVFVRWGYLFPWLCLAATAAGPLVLRGRRRR